MTTHADQPAADDLDESVDDDPTAEPVGPSERTVAVVLLVAGLVGFVAAFALTVEKFLLLTNPAYTPTCTINATVSCTPVMQSWQAAVFGFPNPLLGIGGFAVVAATGAMLLAGGRLARWYRVALQVGLILGAVFAGWLISQSLFVIKALCPYCMAVWVATLSALWYVTLGHLGRRSGGGFEMIRRHHVAILLLVLLVLAGLVVVASLGF